MSIIRYNGTVPFVFRITDEEHSQTGFEPEADFGRSQPVYEIPSSLVIVLRLKTTRCILRTNMPGTETFWGWLWGIMPMRENPFCQYRSFADWLMVFLALLDSEGGGENSVTFWLTTVHSWYNKWAQVMEVDSLMGPNPGVGCPFLPGWGGRWIQHRITHTTGKDLDAVMSLGTSTLYIS